MKCMNVKEIRSLLKRIKSKEQIKSSTNKNINNEEINKLLEETEKLLQKYGRKIPPLKVAYECRINFFQIIKLNNEEVIC